MGNKTSRETLKRQWLLLNRISNKRKGTRFFQNALKEEGLEVSLRTIQRDLNDLSIYFPLQSDEEKIAGWRWAEGARIFDIPGMDSHAALVFKMIRLHLKTRSSSEGNTGSQVPCLNRQRHREPKIYQTSTGTVFLWSH